MTNSTQPEKKSPCPVQLEEGKTYFWCTCGLSAKQPFCDGQHKNSDSGLKSMPFTCEKSEERWLCTCKKTKTPPYCDGSHKD